MLRHLVRVVPNSWWPATPWTSRRSTVSTASRDATGAAVGALTEIRTPILWMVVGFVLPVDLRFLVSRTGIDQSASGAPARSSAQGHSLLLAASVGVRWRTRLDGLGANIPSSGEVTARLFGLASTADRAMWRGSTRSNRAVPRPVRARGPTSRGNREFQRTADSLQPRLSGLAVILLMAEALLGGRLSSPEQRRTDSHRRVMCLSPTGVKCVPEPACRR